MRRASVASLLLACACSKPLPPAFVSAEDEATRAYSAHDYAGAADAWRRAATLAPNERERDEAVYRRAAALERAGRRAEAEALYRQLELGHGERAERAAYSRAQSVLARGERELGMRLLEAALLRFPNSGLAQAATHRVLEHAARGAGDSAELAKLESLLANVRGSELEESLLFLRARWFEEHGQSERAADELGSLVRRFPYPQGKFWDEALIARARLAEARGDYRAALAELEALLAERETARSMGSYERPNFAIARFHIAELYRDRLGQPERARAEFRRVWSDHPTSRLRDDALFEEALTALRSNEPEAACEPARILSQAEPESRFSACVGLLCPTLTSQRPCRDYLRKRIERASEPALPADPPHSSSSR